MSQSLWCKTVQDAEWLRMTLKTLNGSIVPTCWDGVFPAHAPDGCHLCECGGGAAFYETRVGL